jgi:dTDP-4-dehydrorhamnose 3,5-epimerase-like enzyme
MQGIKIYTLEKNKKSPNLIVGEIKKNFNFICKRFFFITGKKNEIRGRHAHKKQLQFLICINGACQLDFDDGKKKQKILLDSNTKGVRVSAGIWGVQKYLKQNTILLVFSDGSYDEKDYLRDYEGFKSYKKLKK